METLSAKAIRSLLRSKRSSLTDSHTSAASQRASQHLVAHPFWKNSHRIAAYLAVGQEADPMSAMTEAIGRGCEVHVPILVDERIRFVPWTPGCPLRKNRYGIDEPEGHSASVDGSAFELVIAPLVGFDDSGNRIGMGSGYYDRCFSFLANRPRPAVPKLVGFAYDLQRVDAIEPAPWDIPMDAIVTESGWLDPPT